MQKFCKTLCYLSYNTCDQLALGECGRLPLCTTYLPNCIKYWLSISKMSSSQYPKQSYFMLFQLDEAEKYTWATCIKNLLFTYGFGHIWITQNAGDVNQLMKILHKNGTDSSMNHQKLYTIVF